MPILVFGYVDDFMVTAFVADRIMSLIVGSNMLLVGVVSSSTLRLPFSLYIIRCSRICVDTFLVLRTVITAHTISATFPWLPAGAQAYRGRRILLAIPVGFITSPWVPATTVLSCALPRLTVVVRILLLTVYYNCTATLDPLVAATFPMLGGGRLARGEEEGQEWYLRWVWSGCQERWVLCWFQFLGTGCPFLLPWGLPVCCCCRKRGFSGGW